MAHDFDETLIGELRHVAAAPARSGRQAQAKVAAIRTLERLSRKGSVEVAIPPPETGIEFALVMGPTEGEFTDAELELGWKAYGSRLMADCHGGRRPWAYWKFELLQAQDGGDEPRRHREDVGGGRPRGGVTRCHATRQKGRTDDGRICTAK